MKAVLCREWGGPDSLRFEEGAARMLKPNEARIRVRACGVNFADTLMIAGKYQIKPEFPFTPGLEAAGEIVEIGTGVNHLAIGTRALAVTRFGGGYAAAAMPRRSRSTPTRSCRSRTRWISSPRPRFRSPTAPRISR